MCNLFMRERERENVIYTYTAVYSCLLYIYYKIQGFCISDMNTCKCPLSHLLYHTPFITPLYHTPFRNTSVFIMRITSRFFHLNAYDSNVTKGGKSNLAYFIKTNCFEHILLISSKGLGTSSNNLLVPLLEVIQYVMRNK